MKKYLFIGLGLTLMTGLFAQKITLKSGDLSILKGITELNVEFDYSNMAVGKFDKEQDYIDKKVKDYNENEAGTGDKWKEAWVNDRETRYEPKFFELFNERIIEVGAKSDKNLTNAKYTMIVHTTFTEPGYNVGVSRSPAKINAEISIVETANKSKQLVVILVVGSPGGGAMGYDFDAGFRIQESYAKMGKSLGAYLVKEKAF